MIASHSASRFKTTSWTLIVGAHGDREALEALLRRYWGPVYAYLRRDGHNPDQAEELSQAFMVEVLIGRNLLARADAARGRFRSFLLKSLKHYLVDVHRHEHGRDGRRECVSISGDEMKRLRQQVIDSGSPDEAFTRHWATTVLNQALERMRQTYEGDGRAMHWRIFEERTLRPFLYGNQAASVSALANEGDLGDASQVSNMLHTAKRKFVATLLEVIAETVDDSADIEAELNELVAALSRS